MGASLDQSRRRTREAAEEALEMQRLRGLVGQDMGTIIVVARNNVHLTKQAVATALAQDIPCRTILIDNASTDGTTSWGQSIRNSDLSRITLMRQQSLAACWNYALDVALKDRPDALVINNDVELRPDTYRLLREVDAPFKTCVSVDSKERMGVVGDRDASSFAPRPHPDFSCFMITKDCWLKVGRFNEECWPAYVEDSFYHVRMHRAGVKAVCVDLPFLHHGAGTLKHASEQERVIIERGAEWNRQRFFKAYGCYPGSAEYQALFK